MLKARQQAWKIHFALPKPASSVDNCVWKEARAAEVAWEALKDTGCIQDYQFLVLKKEGFKRP